MDSRTSKELVGALSLLRNAEGEPWVTLRESDAKRLTDEFDSLQRRLAAREELVDGYEKQLGIDEADATITVGSEIARLLEIEKRATAEPCPVPGFTTDDDLTQQAFKFTAMPKMSNAEFHFTRGGILRLMRHLERTWNRAAPPPVPEQWQPIETAPKDGTEILLASIPQCFEGKPVPARVTVGHWTTDEESRVDVGDCGGPCHCREYEHVDPYWMSWDGGFTAENPATHWMPLPSPPTKGESL